MKEKIATIFGGTGFLGRHLIRRLTKKDYRIIIATRSPYLSGFLKPLGNPGQIEIVKTNIFNPEEVKKILKHSNISINLIGILHENSKQKFKDIHSNFPNLLSSICKELNLDKLVHISSLGVKKDHPSNYMQSKFEGEKNIQKNFQRSIILRPSVVFGPEDKFFNKFASFAQFSPVIPLIGGGKTKFDPVYVGDVAQAIVKSLDINNFEKNIFELGGPSTYSFKKLMEILLKEIKKRRILLPVPFNLVKFQSYFLQILPNPLITPDQVTMLKYDNVISGNKPTLKNLDIEPTSIQSILPNYIYRFRTGGQFG